MLGSIVTAFMLGTPGEALTKAKTQWPMLSVVLAINVAILASLLAGLLPGAIIGGLVLVSVLVQNGRPGGVFATGRARRLASVAVFASVAAFVPVLFGVYMPERCATLGPGLFIFAWPLTAFLAVLAGRVASLVGEQEGWLRSDMPMESLGALVLLSAVGSFLLAGASSCVPNPLAFLAMALVVAFGGVAISGLFERKEAPKA